MAQAPDEWYWDLQLGKAVPASERGAGDHVLGPYPSRFDAENWKQTVEQRNEEWSEADEEWSGDAGPGEPGDENSPTGDN